MDEIYAILSQSVLCKQLSEEQIRSWMKNCQMQIVSYPKGTAIFKEEDRPKYLYVLLSGHISVVRYGFSGKQVRLADFTNVGDLFGEVYLYMKKEQYNLSAVASKNSRVLQIQSDIFDKDHNKMDSNQVFILYNLLTLFATKAYTLNQRLQVLSGGSLRERLIRFLYQFQKEDGSIVVPMRREDMADYLNTTRPSLSRELRNLCDEGLLQVDGRKMKVMDQDGVDSYL